MSQETRDLLDCEREKRSSGDRVEATRLRSSIGMFSKYDIED